MNNIDNFFDTAIRSLPLPSVAEEGIIVAKNFLKDEDQREKLLDVFQKVINNGGDFIKNIWKVKDTVVDKGIKEGIAETFDMAVEGAKKGKVITKKTADMLQEGKEFLVDKFLKEENIFKNQEKYLEDINNEYDKWEKALNTNNIEQSKEIQKDINKKCEKILPTVDLIYKINNMDNTMNLVTAKEDKITNLEKEILSKIA